MKIDKKGGEGYEFLSLLTEVKNILRNFSMKYLIVFQNSFSILPTAMPLQA